MAVAASYPISAQKLLTLNLGLGYKAYLEHPRYSTWLLQSGTQVAFDLSVKDFLINIHDRVNFVQDVAQQTTLVGTADYATINNSAGLGVTWDLNEATLTVGYDHENIISVSQGFNSQDRSVEQLLGRAGFHLNPKITVGVETTAGFSRFDQMVLNNNSVYSAGLFAEWDPGKAIKISPRVGYTITSFSHSSSSIQTADLDSWYADLNITHQITEAVSYSLDAGRETRTGIQSDAVEDWFLRPSVQWNVIRNVSLSTFFSYEHGNQGVGNIAGNLTETYDSVSGGISAGYQIMKRLSLGVSYRITSRTSNAALRDYTQNMVGITITYLSQ